MARCRATCPPTWPLSTTRQVNAKPPATSEEIVLSALPAEPLFDGVDGHWNASAGDGRIQSRIVLGLDDPLIFCRGANHEARELEIGAL